MIAPVGVYANQPNPWEENNRRVFKLFWKLALAAIVLQLALTCAHIQHPGWLCQSSTFG